MSSTPDGPASTALVPAGGAPGGALAAPNSFRSGLSLEKFAAHAFASGWFNKGGKLPNVSAAVVVLQFGSDLGLSASASLNSIFFYDGRPSMSGNLMWSLVKRDPVWGDSEIEECDNAKCVIVWRKTGADGVARERGRSAFTIEEAKGAGLVGKDNWRKYPSDMLFNRAVSRGFRRYCPHLGLGHTIYTPDEMGAVTDQNGDPIEAAQFTVAGPALPGAAPAEPPLERLKKVIAGTGVTLEQVAGVLDLSMAELADVTPAELLQVERFVKERQALAPAPAAAKQGPTRRHRRQHRPRRNARRDRPPPGRPRPPDPAPRRGPGRAATRHDQARRPQTQWQ